MRFALLLAVLGVLTSARTAHAFSEPRTYYDDPGHGGGGGRWFTGSPAEGMGCSVCHTGGGSAKLQVMGLPATGYVPNMTYDVTVSWPEFAARFRALRAAAVAVPGSPEPSMGLVAELVSESGYGAGKVEILDPSVASPLDLCQMPAGGGAGQPPIVGRAAQLYSVRPGEPTEERALSCDAGPLGQRCLVAVLPCGAEQLHLRWTAPPNPIGPIWFAAGFVTTENVSGTPQGDAVKEYAAPMLAASSNAERYESELTGSCSARAPRMAATRAGARTASCWGAFLLIGMLVRRRRVLARVRARARAPKELG